MFESSGIHTSGQGRIRYIVGFLLGARNDTECAPGVLVFSHTVLYFDVRAENKILGIHLVVFFDHDGYAEAAIKLREMKSGVLMTKSQAERYLKVDLGLGIKYLARKKIQAALSALKDAMQSGFQDFKIELRDW